MASAFDASAALEDPRARAALLSFGLSLMQPMSIGQTPLGHLGQSIGAAGQSVTANEAADLKEFEAESKADLRTAQADTAAAKAETAATRAQAASALGDARLGLARDRLALDQQRAADLSVARQQALTLRQEALNARLAGDERRALMAEAQLDLAERRLQLMEAGQTGRLELGRDALDLRREQGQQRNDIASGRLGVQITQGDRRLDQRDRALDQAAQRVDIAAGNSALRNTQGERRLDQVDRRLDQQDASREARTAASEERLRLQRELAAARQTNDQAKIKQAEERLNQAERRVQGGFDARTTSQTIRLQSEYRKEKANHELLAPKNAPPFPTFEQWLEQSPQLRSRVEGRPGATTGDSGIPLAPTNPKDRQRGQQYKSPNGKIGTWTGDGWLLAQ